MSTDPATTISVVIVNYKGSEDTITCLRAFDNCERPAGGFELIVVENDSKDGSAQRIREAVPEARVIEAKKNLGFAGGCNLGVEKAKGRYIAFINNDARPGAGFLTESVAALEREISVAAVATKVLDWDGRAIDFVSAGMSWYGQAFKLHVGEEDKPEFDIEREILFGTGSSLVVRREAFLDVGGFDEDYFMFFEDVDLGWRFWLLGYRVLYVPKAVSFHKHHASMSGIGKWREQYLLERNALWTIYKNYDDDNLARLLPGALALSVRRGVVLGGEDPDSLDLAHGLPPEDPARVTTSKTTLASTYAVDAFTRSLGRFDDKRTEIQARRRRSDAEIVRMFGRPMMPNIDDPGFLSAYGDVVRAFGVEERFAGRRRILVATGDTVAARMAGPAIRAWNIARALSREHDVRLVTTAGCDLSHPAFEISFAGPREMIAHEAWADVIVFQGYLMHEHEVLRASNKIIVADIYDPFHLEQLEQARDLGGQRRREVVQSATAVLNEQLARGDYFTCASAKQRDFWLGQLAALGRVNPAVYDADETLDNLLSIVPFGVGDEPPVATRPMVKGVIPGIGPDDKVILWGGGIYNWFDPLTLIRAVDRLKKRVPEIRLLFMGVKHPNPAVPEMRMAVQARDLAASLGLLGTHVIFNEEWVAYEDRQNFLLESDIGVSTHYDHVETAFSFRTRILDYIWASLPIVCTDGDSLAALVKEHDLGRVVPAEDVEALAESLAEILEQPSVSDGIKDNLARIAPEYRWERVLEPLVNFCRDPHRAPDLVEGGASLAIPSSVSVVPPPWTGVRGDLGLVRSYLAAGGVSMLAAKAAGRVRRVVSRQPRR